ncbi:MAG: response regulator transcription factor [Paludibacteraceae bacterium]|nr:response regulator transcription factor [Paludibacteraceae bacterium]
MASSRYKIALIEPAPLIAAGVKSMLGECGQFEVAYAFSSLQAYDVRASHIHPDIVMLSPYVLDFSARLSVRTAVCCPENAALVALVSSHFDEKTLRQFDAAIDVYDDLQSVTQKLSAALKLNAEGGAEGDSYNLSDRELEILVAVAKGLTNKEIAEQHDISVNTVITHRKNITRKTGIKSVSGLTVYALLNNLIDQTDVE